MPLFTPLQIIIYPQSHVLSSISFVVLRSLYFILPICIRTINLSLLFLSLSFNWDTFEKLIRMHKPHQMPTYIGAQHCFFLRKVKVVTYLLIDQQHIGTVLREYLHDRDHTSKISYCGTFFITRRVRIQIQQNCDVIASQNFNIICSKSIWCIQHTIPKSNTSLNRWKMHLTKNRSRTAKNMIVFNLCVEMLVTLSSDICCIDIISSPMRRSRVGSSSKIWSSTAATLNISGKASATYTFLLNFVFPFMRFLELGRHHNPTIIEDSLIVILVC